MKNKNTLSDALFIIFNLVIAIILFVIANPNFITTKGISLFAWFIYIPVLFIIHKSKLRTVWLTGFLYGGLSYLLLVYWLKNYDSFCLYPVIIFYAVCLSLLFLVLKLTDMLFKRDAWLVQWLIICSYEYLKTLGFLGFSYGVTAYTQWNHPVIIQICSLVGVFGFNLLVILPACIIYAFIRKLKERRKIIYMMETDNSFYDCKTHVNYVSEYDKKVKQLGLKLTVIVAALWCCVFIATIIYGKAVTDDDTQSTVKIALIQHNEDPFEDGVNVYRKNIQKLMALTDNALEIVPDIDFVVWPETAVVPSIEYQYYTHKDEVRYKLVSSLLEYIDSRNPVFIIGNGVRAFDEKTGKGNEKFNSALVFIPGKNVLPPDPQVYNKIHLVPVSEYFPYEEKLPRLSSLIMKHEKNMWTPGSEYKVFFINKSDKSNIPGTFNFSTLICYEDTFTNIARQMYLNGARCFINLSNDSWSKSEACQYQHLANAVFRSVENRVPSVRSTASGQSCIINQFGQIEKMAPSFCETYVVGEVPVFNSQRKATLYTKYGDVSGYGAVFLSAALLIMRLIIVIIISIRNKLKK